MKFKKNKLLLASFMFLVGLWVNIYASTNLHLLLSGEMKRLIAISARACIHSMATNEQHGSLFLCLQGYILLFCLFTYLTNNKPYQSDLVRLTSNIETPVEAGQKQFGSAKWLTEKEKTTVFSQYTIDRKGDGFACILNQNQIVQRVIAERKQEDEKSKQKVTGISQREIPSPEYAIPAVQIEGDSAKTKTSQEDHHPQIDSGGIVIGQNAAKNKELIQYIESDTHTLCIGATRSGKTRTVVLQSIGTLGLAAESMVLSDPKGELYSYTAPFLKALGYEVICLDFKNPTKSDRYNFLQPIIDAINQNDLSKAVDATWDLTAALVPENTHSEKIWTNGEASIIASAIMAVVYDNRKGNDQRFQNMSNVYFFISEMCKSIDNSMPLLKYMKTLPSNHPAKALLAISEVAPSKTRGSFYTSALTTLRLFTNPMIYGMTNISDFNQDRIGDAKQAIFIILPDEKTTYYSLASLFVNQCYMQLVKNADERGGRLKRRINFMLEEFGNFVKIPDFANKLTVGGGRGIRFNLFIQSFTQLDEKYGKETAGTIKSNCETWIYLQADDLTTLEEISKKLGNYTVSTYSLSSSHAKFSSPSSSHSINLTHRALLTVDEVRLISRPYTLITSRNNPALMILPDLSQWYFNTLFGLGDKEHNRMVRAYRDSIRPERRSDSHIDTWNIWEYFTQQEKPQFIYKQYPQGDGENENRDS